MVDAHIRGVKFSPSLKHSSMNVDIQCRFKPYSLHNVIMQKFKNNTMRLFKKILGWLIVITIYGGAFLIIASKLGTNVTATSFAVLFILVGALVLAEKLTSGKL